MFFVCLLVLNRTVAEAENSPPIQEKTGFFSSEVDTEQIEGEKTRNPPLKKTSTGPEPEGDQQSSRRRTLAKHVGGQYIDLGQFSDDEYVLYCTSYLPKKHMIRTFWKIGFN